MMPTRIPTPIVVFVAIASMSAEPTTVRLAAFDLVKLADAVSDAESNTP
jgi:hypothetical protein